MPRLLGLKGQYTVGEYWPEITLIIEKLLKWTVQQNIVPDHPKIIYKNTLKGTVQFQNQSAIKKKSQGNSVEEYRPKIRLKKKLLLKGQNRRIFSQNQSETKSILKWRVQENIMPEIIKSTLITVIFSNVSFLFLTTLLSSHKHFDFFSSHFNFFMAA